MCIDLMQCKKKATDLHHSENCPRKENDRKEGIMNLTLHYWNSMGYQHLNKTAQNLRDKLAHVEETTKATSTRITDEIRQQQQESQTCNRPNSTSESTPKNSSFISTRGPQD